MAALPEWGHAASTVVTAVTEGNRPRLDAEPVTSAAALMFSTRTGNGFVLEGSPSELAATLAEARRAIAPLVADDALDKWRTYNERRAELERDEGYPATEAYEMHHSPRVARALAAALETLTD